MKRRIIMTIGSALVLAVPALAGDTNTQLSLEITLDHGAIMGYVSNIGTNNVHALCPNGEEEGLGYISLLYRVRGSGWSGACCTGVPQRVHATGLHSDAVVKPCEVLPYINIADGLSYPYTYRINLANYSLPISIVTELRLVAGDLWSNIIKVDDPSQLRSAGTNDVKKSTIPLHENPKKKDMAEPSVGSAGRPAPQP